jgi:hypothetical protein
VFPTFSRWATADEAHAIYSFQIRVPVDDIHSSISLVQRLHAAHRRGGPTGGNLRTAACGCTRRTRNVRRAGEFIRTNISRRPRH